MRLALCGALAILTVGATGCATSNLAAARTNFERGHWDRADLALATIPGDETDRVLALMERGMIRQARGDYAASARDWLDAVEEADRLDYHSVSRGITSMAVNDRVLSYRGAPYERVLVHAFAAKSYLALGLWDDAAVEARNIIFKLENRSGFPDDAYARYLAAFCLEMAGDDEGARFQYRQLKGLLTGLTVDDHTGQITPAGTNTAAAAAARTPPRAGDGELVCFVSIGQAPRTGERWPSIGWGSAPYAELYAGDRYLGRTYPLTDTARLQAETRQKKAALQATKDVTRVVAKEVLSQAVESQDELLGQLLRLILFAMERPDDRRWETLPQWLQVARVPCPADLSSYRVVFVGPGGRRQGERWISHPVSRHGKSLVSFCRDLTEAPVK